MVLNFDKAINVHLILRQGDSYDKTFLVIRNGVDYDWAGVSDIIMEVKKTKTSSDKVIELKRSTGEIETTTGQMIWHLSPAKTNVEPAEYSSFELLVLFNTGKPKLWIDGACTIKPRGIKIV